MLNPKALIIALTMVPPAHEVPVTASIATLASMVLAASSIWLSVGRVILGREKQIPPFARRCGSATLVAFSAMLTFSAVSG